MSATGSDTDVEVVATNFKRRFTGVSATILALVPLQVRSLRIAILGAPLPGVPRARFAALLARGWRPPRRRPFRIWHARRNSEMLAGIVLRSLLRQRWRLVFTSAAIRRHSFFPRLLIRAMDAVIATTPAAAALVPHVAAIVPHGVDTDAFAPAAAGKRACWQAAGLGGDYCVGTFGRVRPEKGTDIFVDALCALLPKRPGIHAVIAGHSAPEHQAFRRGLEAKIAAAGIADRVHWVGQIPPGDLPAWYRRCLVVAAPARYEGYGLTILEAMAAGCATVAAPTGGFPMMIAEGETGTLLHDASAAALAAALAPLLDDPDRAEAMGKAGRTRAVAEFSVAGEAAAINAVYERLWASGAARG